MSTEEVVVLSWEVEGVAELTTTDKSLAVQMHNDIPWNLIVRKHNNNAVDHLAVHLECYTDCIYEHFALKHASKLVIVNRTDVANNVVHELSTEFNRLSTTWGKNEMFLFNDLLDANRGFIADNKILLEAHITVKSIQGLKKVVHYDFTQDKGMDNVALTVEDQKLFFLSVESPFFADLFFNEDRPKDESDFVLKTVKVEDFTAFLMAIYPSNKAITVDSWKPVLALAECFQVQRAIDVVEQYLMHTKKITVGAKLVLSEKHKLDLLQDHCIQSFTDVAELLKTLKTSPELANFSCELKAKIFDRLMMSTDDPPRLPTDVIRKVIGYANHSVEEMRLVNHTWKHLVSDEFAKLSNIPPIDELVISHERRGELNFIVAELRMRRGLGFALRDFHKLGYNIAQTTQEMITTRKTLYEVILMHETNAFSVIRKVNRIKLKDMQTRTTFLQYIFRGVRSDIISVKEGKMNKEYSKAVLKLIRDWKCTRASFEVHDIDYKKFLMEIAECVDTIYFKQTRATKYLFGHTQEDFWLQTLADMLGKRVKKIKIEHDNSSIVANHNITRYFKEHLCKQSWRPWLEINASRDFSATISENGLVLEVTPDYDTRCCLVKMKHRSRVDEPF